MVGKDGLQDWTARGMGCVGNLSSFLPEVMGCVCLTHSSVPSWSVPTRAEAGHTHVVCLLSDGGGGGGGGLIVDGRSPGWGIKAPEELEFWYQRRKEE